MEWYYADESEKQHIVAAEELPVLVAAGTIRPETLLWNETLSGWRPAPDLRPDLFPGLAYPPILTPAQRREVGYPGNSVLPGQPAPTDAVSICSLIFGILGLIFCGAPIFSVPAIICGHIGRKRARMELVPSSNGGLCLAGLIMGYIGLAFFALLILFYVGVFAAAFIGASMEGIEATPVP